MIIPYFRSSNAGDIEVLKENWLDSVGGILAQCAAVSFGASQGEKLADIVLSAFSFGIRYCDLARKHMTGLAAGYLPKVWDFDGIYSGTDGHLSAHLTTTSSYRVIMYGQKPSREYINISGPQWIKMSGGIPNPDDIHQAAVGSFL